MRVLHFSPHSIISGTEKHILLLVKGLAAKGCECEVLLPLDGPLGDAVRDLGMAVHVCDWIGAKVLGLCRLARLIRRRRLDIVHSHAYSRLPCLAAAIARGPFVVETRHTGGDAPGPSAMDPLRRLKHRLLDRAVGRVIAVSGEVRDKTVAAGYPPSQVDIIPNGIDGSELPSADDAAARAEARQRMGVPPGAFVIGTAARLSAEKGLDVLLDAVAVLRKADRVRCVIAGCGAEEERLHAQARSLGIADDVSFLGHRSDMPLLYAGFDCFVLPSRYEGCPVALLEAFHVGLPAVVSDIASTREVLGESGAGLQVPVGDSVALAAALARVQGEPATRRTMSEAARERSRSFGVDRMVERTLAVYERAADGRG